MVEASINEDESREKKISPKLAKNQKEELPKTPIAKPDMRLSLALPSALCSIASGFPLMPWSVMLLRQPGPILYQLQAKSCVSHRNFPWLYWHDPQSYGCGEQLIPHFEVRVEWLHPERHRQLNVQVLRK